MKTFPFLILFFLFSLSVESQTKFDFDTTMLLSNLEAFSSDEMGGRGVMEPGGDKARKFISDRFATMELLPFDGSYQSAFKFANRMRKSQFEGLNIMGWMRGTDYPNKYIVISSHHDHLGTRDGEIYNGADDNGSGTCALFSIAEHFKANPPKHSLIFVAFDAEEHGLIGSKHFVHKPPVSLKKIVFNLNMDMISRNADNELYLCGTAHYPKLKPLFSQLDNESPLSVLFGHDTGAMRSEDWTFASDHAAFHKEKIPFIYLGVADHEDYHKPTDDFENIDRAFYVEAVNTAIRIITLRDNTK